MARWEPNARERLQAAAMALFEDRGYDRTTVSDIAARAQLTDRTFFRYFSDKREILASGAEELEQQMVSTIASAPRTMPPLEVVAAAIEAASSIFEANRAHARKRQALIAAHAELQERELIKSAKLAFAIATGLRERGTAGATAELLASTGMVLFHSAFVRWLEDAKKRDFAHHVRATLVELRRVTAAKSRSATSPKRRANA